MKADTTAETATDTTTKLDTGRQNPVETPFEFHTADAVPFDVTALYSYLFEQAECHYTCGCPEDVVAIFETEFASSGAVPNLTRTTVADRLAENEMAKSPPGDDLKRDALVTFFVDEYSRMFAAAPDELPDPRGVPVSTSQGGRGRAGGRFRRWLSSLRGFLR